jgi:glutaconate CoA-transferase subunit B
MRDVTAEELMAVTASRLLADHKVVFAGVGMPLLASAVARHRQAPHLTIVLEGGIIGTTLLPGKLPISTNEMRAAYGAQMLTDITDVFLYAQRGFFDYGFLGAAQVDMYGNINTSVIGSMERPRVRLPGSGGANDIISLCNEVLIVTQHEPRRFVERVDFITSPGYLSGGDSRARAGLACGRLGAVVTDLALLDFEPASRRMRLRGLQAGVTVGEVRAQTGFDLLVSEEIEELTPPSAEELAIYRELCDGPAAAGTGDPAAGTGSSAADTGSSAPARGVGPAPGGGAGSADARRAAAAGPVPAGPP